MATYNFVEIKHKESRSGVCTECGGKMTRSTTFSQTLSPFNKNADGSPRTTYQIKAELEERAKFWDPDMRHEKCGRTT